jgi:hypothetical protein
MPKINTPAECPKVLTRRDSFTVQSYNVVSVQKAIHGGALWQPRIKSVGDYDSVIAADVNDARYSPSPRVLEALRNGRPSARFRRLAGVPAISLCAALDPAVTGAA